LASAKSLSGLKMYVFAMKKGLYSRYFP